MPWEDKMIGLRETQLGCAIVELLQHMQACRVQGRRSPASRRLRSADVQQTIGPVDVLGGDEVESSNVG
jgi:hypothetical protein